MRHFAHQIWKKWLGHDRLSLVETKMRHFELLAAGGMARDLERQASNTCRHPQSPHPTRQHDDYADGITPLGKATLRPRFICSTKPLRAIKMYL